MLSVAYYATSQQGVEGQSDGAVEERHLPKRWLRLKIGGPHIQADTGALIFVFRVVHAELSFGLEWRDQSLWQRQLVSGEQEQCGNPVGNALVDPYSCSQAQIDGH